MSQVNYTASEDELIKAELIKEPAYVYVRDATPAELTSWYNTNTEASFRSTYPLASATLFKILRIVQWLYRKNSTS